ncbi:MAG: WD40 repeat domain-containing protein [Bacteroidota bacterium]
MKLNAIQSIEGHVGAIYDVLYTKDNKAYTTSADKFVARWNLETGEQDRFAVRLEFSGFRVALNPQKNILAIGNSKGAIHVVDLNTNKEQRLLAQHQVGVFALTYCEKQNVFYSGDAEGYFCVWDGDNFDLLLTYPFECGKIRQVAINENGKYIAICGQDGIIRILETEFFNEIQTFKAHKLGANCAVFCGDLIYTGGKDAHINLWDWKTANKIASIPAHNYAVYDLILLRDNAVLVSASFDKTIKMFDAEDLSIQQRIEFKDGGHRHVVNRLAKQSESAFLSVSDDKKIKSWVLEG